jgi:hypothetical protein
VKPCKNNYPDTDHLKMVRQSEINIMFFHDSSISERSSQTTDI